MDFLKKRALHKKLRKTRFRDPEVQEELTDKVILDFERAKEQGKFKIIENRKVYYDPSEWVTPLFTYSSKKRPKTRP